MSSCHPSNGGSFARGSVFRFRCRKPACWTFGALWIERRWPSSSGICLESGTWLVRCLALPYKWYILIFVRYRTPVCILYPQKIIATACFVLAQRIIDGPNSPSLDARISASAPSNSLPTPPSHKPPSPDATRYAIDHFLFNEIELSSVSGSFVLIISALYKGLISQSSRNFEYSSGVLSRARRGDLPVSILNNHREYHLL